MRVAIEPRKATDRGGYYCMPLKVNVPTGRKNWKLTKCPECGAQCWELRTCRNCKSVQKTQRDISILSVVRSEITGGAG